MAEETLIGDIDIGSDIKIQISMRQFKGREYVDIRRFKQFGYEPDYTPTKKGITIPLSRLSEVICLLKDAEEHFEEDMDRAILIREELKRIEKEE